MLDVSVLPAFLLAVTVILVTPGPDMAFMVATGIDQGRRAADGAGYLAVLAITTWRRAGAPLAEAATVPNVFRRGFVVNITNPKIALFFVAFLPQFLGTAGGSGENPFAQILMLGLLLQLTGLVTDLAIGGAAGLFRDAVLGRPRVRHVLDGAAGTVYAALAVLLVLGVMRQ